MEFGRKGTEYFSSDLEKDLIELIQVMHGVQSGITMGPTAWFPGEGKIAEWIHKAREIANKHHVQSFTVSVGIPLGVQVSFTFETDTKGSLRGGKAFI